MKWIVGDKGGPAGPFYSVVRQDGRIIAMQIPDKVVAEQIALLPLIRELASEADKYDCEHNPSRHITLQKLFDVLGQLSDRSGGLCICGKPINHQGVCAPENKEEGAGKSTLFVGFCTDARHVGPFSTTPDGYRKCDACGEEW